MRMSFRYWGRRNEYRISNKEYRISRGRKNTLHHYPSIFDVRYSIFYLLLLVFFVSAVPLFFTFPRKDSLTFSSLAAFTSAEPTPVFSMSIFCTSKLEALMLPTLLETMVTSSALPDSFISPTL